MRAAVIFMFFLMLFLILVVYWVGTTSELLSFAKVGEQIGFFLTGRNSAGGYGADQRAS